MVDQTSDPLDPSLDPRESFKWALQATKTQNWREALYRWTVLRQAFPDRPAPWVHSAGAYIKLGELKAASSLILEARTRFPNAPHILMISAELALLSNDWHTAEHYLERAREEAPERIQSWLKSAELAELRGDRKRAEVYLKEAQKHFTDRADPFLEYAEIAMRSEQWEEALSRWADFRERFPDNSIGYLRAAEAARELNLPKEAKRLTLANQYGSDFLTDSDDFRLSIKAKQPRSRLRHLAELIWTKAIFNLRSEVHRNYLSYGWWVLEPMLHMVVYYVVFGFLLQRGGENYTVFLLTGLIPWMWFMKAVSGSSNSILGGQNLMLQVGLPSIVFPLVSILQSTLKQIPVFILLVGFVWLQGYTPNIHWWLLFPIVMVQALLTLFFACTVAAIIPFVRDLAYLVPTGLTFLMFLSGIFYDYKNIAPEWQRIFLLNPVAFLIKSYRDVLMDGGVPDIVTLMWWGIGCIVGCLLLVLSYNRLRYIYPRIVIQ